MKLVYLVIGGSTKISSVYKKVFGQIDAFAKNGIDAKGIIFSPEIKEDLVLRPNVLLKAVSKPETKIFDQIKLHKKYEEKVAYTIINSDADVIYLRYTFSSKKIVDAIKKSNKKVFIERNSIVIPELIAGYKNNKFKLKLGYFLSLYQNLLYPLTKELFYGRKINKACDIVVCVTREIARYYSGYKVNCKTIGNGIDTSKYPPRTAPLLREKLIILILDGTSANTPWKGTDRLIRSVITQGLQSNIEIRVAGNTKLLSEYSFVKVLGFLDPEEIAEQCNKVHIGTGNLKLYKKNLMEGSVLKNREYASRGLPILLAHNDLDIEESKLNDYCFKVDNSDSDIPIKAMINWAKELYLKHPKHPIKMHELSKSKLDFDVKAKELISIINGIN
jgi:hypothetical protein